MEDKVVFIKDIKREDGSIAFKKGNDYRLLLEDGNGFFIAYNKKSDECALFPESSLNVDFNIK